MKDLVAKFPQQLQEALEIASRATLSKSSAEIRNVLISGLGGSGIGGTIVSELLLNETSVPILVNKDYFIPSYVNEHSLVIISSYSGNTEETLHALDMALKAKAKIVCVTSGGKVMEIAKSEKLDLISIPGGMPPRSCLGYSFTQLFAILQFFEIIQLNYQEQIKNAIELIQDESASIKEEAMDLAKKLVHKIPVIYSLGATEGVSIRFRQQVNENSKMLCWHHVLPEMNHNELVGWTTKNENLAVVIFSNGTDYYRTKKRLEVSKEIFAKYTSTLVTVSSKGDSAIERAIYLIHLGDWASCYMADIKSIDAVEVNVINHLKGELGKI